MDDETLAARRNHASEIITSGRIWSAVWYLAWPTAVNTLIQTAYNIINRVFLGRLGSGAEVALAAAGIGGTALMVQFALMLGLSVGTSALVSRFLGAKEYDDADEAARQSLILSVVGGAITMVPLIVFAGPIARLAGAQGQVAPLAGRYMAIIAWFSIPGFIFMVVTSALRSAGDVRSPLYVGAVVIWLNVLLDWLLIFGVGPFPRLGVIGAAIATSVSRVVGTVLILWFLKRSILARSLTRMRARFEWFGRIMRIGFPACIQNLVFSTSFVGYVKILGYLPDATAAQAGLTVGIAIESTAFMPGVAYGAAATPLVGQNLGAGKPERAERSAWVAAGQAAGIMSVVAFFFVIIPRPLALLVTNQASVVPLVVSYLRINAISEPFQALGFVMRGALQGAGETRVPAWIAFITSWVLRLPLAWVLGITLGYGAAGAWVAMSVTTILSGLLAAAWFVWGNWREIAI